MTLGVERTFSAKTANSGEQLMRPRWSARWPPPVKNGRAMGGVSRCGASSNGPYNLLFPEGWSHDTLPTAPVEKLALLRLG